MVDCWVSVEMANGDGLRQNQSDRYAMAKRNFTKVKRICFSKQRNEGLVFSYGNSSFVFYLKKE